MPPQSLAVPHMTGFSLPSLRLNDLSHIPGDEGWPVLGNTIKILKDPHAFSERMHATHGPVYRNRSFGRRTVTLLGPEANELVLFDRDKVFSSQHGWEPVLGQLFPRGLMLRDFDEHRLHRRAMSVAFKSEPMKAYLAALDSGISSRVEKWRKDSPNLLFYPAIKQLTLDVAATSFLGDDLGPQGDAIQRAFVDMVAAAVGIVRKPLPGTLMKKGVQGRARIIELFGSEVPRRRTGKGEDIFSQLCRATGDDGVLLSNADIVDHMSFLMMAAHDTITSSVTSLVYLLAANPEWQDKLRAEVQGLGLNGAPLPFERLDDLPLIEMAFKEAMRLYPPVPSIPRRAVRAFEFMGHKIPAGANVAVNPLFTHRMASIWPEPDKFDPLRFTEEAARGRHKFAWVPFGGGAHMCLGLHFAYMQVKCFFYHLLGSNRIELAPGAKADWQILPIPKPKDGLPIVLKPL